MRLCAAVVLASLFVAPTWATDPLTEADEATLASFQAFVPDEWQQILSEISTGMENAIELTNAKKFPMSSKNMYLVFWVKEEPENYLMDVQRTNSLQTPLKGVIRFNVSIAKGAVFVKGPRKNCVNKPLKECLAAGGKLATGMFSMGGDFTVTQLHEVVLAYRPSDTGWERERDESILEIIATMPSITSLEK